MSISPGIHTLSIAWERQVESAYTIIGSHPPPSYSLDAQFDLTFAGVHHPPSTDGRLKIILSILFMRTLWFTEAAVKYVNMLLLLLLLFVEPGLGRDPINIYWNSTNPIFSSSNPTLIDVNKNTGPWEYDQINIICPSGPRTTEKHVIYSVNKGKQN